VEFGSQKKNHDDAGGTLYRCRFFGLLSTYTLVKKEWNAEVGDRSQQSFSQEGRGDLGELKSWGFGGMKSN
jgi:hypothetical protein